MSFLIVCGVKTNFNGIHCVLLEVTTKTLLETSQGSIFSIWLPGLIHIWHQLYRFTSAKTLVLNSHLTVSLVFKSCPLKNNPYFRILPQMPKKSIWGLKCQFLLFGLGLHVHFISLSHISIEFWLTLRLTVPVFNPTCTHDLKGLALCIVPVLRLSSREHLALCICLENTK